MKLYPVLAAVNCLFVIVQFAINGLSGSGPDGTIFKNSTGDLSDVYYTAITPAGWTFSIWGFIYTWLALWVVYTLVNICRKGPAGQPAYDDPQFIPNVLFAFNIIIAALNIMWLITFDRQEIEVACATLIAYTLVMYGMLGIGYRALDKASPELVEQKRTKEIWLTRGLVFNAIAMQVTWVNIATLLNLQMVLIYSGDKLVSADTAGTIALVILSVHVIVLPILDLVCLDRYTRYSITPYIVLVVALSGSISKNWDAEKDNSIFSAVLLAYVCVLFVVKIALTLYRHFTKPRFTTLYQSDDDSDNELKSKEKNNLRV